MNLHRNVLGAVAVVASLLSAGCPSEEKKAEHTTVAAAPPPAPTPAPTPAATTAAVADTAAAVADTTPLPAPPADQAETPGAAPSPHHTWIPGYHYWAGRAYAWHAGYWEDTTGFATMAPPALQVEHPGMAPGANYAFLPGYWHWSGKKYDWAPGHWSVPRAGFAYVHPSYIEDKGHYVRQGLGWEKEDAAWKKKYATFEKHGEVYVHKAEVAEFVKRGEKEGWMKGAAMPMKH